jgi:hypothetical protein
MLVEAAIASGSSLDALLAGADEPAVKAWGETLSFPERVADLEHELQEHGALLASAVNDLATMKDAMRNAGLWDAGGNAAGRSATGTEQ